MIQKIIRQCHFNVISGTNWIINSTYICNTYVGNIFTYVIRSIWTTWQVNHFKCNTCVLYLRILANSWIQPLCSIFKFTNAFFAVVNFHYLMVARIVLWFENHLVFIVNVTLDVTVLDNTQKHKWWKTNESKLK